MPTQPIFLADTNVFITARDDYYAFDICPGFWRAIINHHAQGSIRSIDKVKNELLYTNENLPRREDSELFQWVTNFLPSDFFHASSTDSQVMDEFQSITEWVKHEQQYRDNAKRKFLDSADSWLVAYGKAHGATVITHEKSEPNSEKSIKIPDICARFGVECGNTYYMLRELKVKFDLQPPR